MRPFSAQIACFRVGILRCEGTSVALGFRVSQNLARQAQKSPECRGFLLSRCCHGQACCQRETTEVAEFMAHSAGFEPTTPAFGGQYSIQLSYECNAAQ